MKRALPYLALLCAGAAAAEEAPFYRCSFDDGRVIDLAQADAGFEWRERDFRAPVVTEPQQQHDPILTFVGIWDDPERLDVFVGWQADGGPTMDIGAAMLSRTTISATGQFQSVSTPGTCADYVP